MKRIFTILAFCFPLFAFGQTFVITPVTDFTEEYETNERSGNYFYIKNVSGEARTLHYEKLSDTFLEDWNTTFCAGINCYTYIPEFEDFGEMADTTETFVNFTTNFGETTGEGTVVLRFFDPNDASYADTLSVTYTVVEGTSGTNNLVNNYNFKLSPNPTAGAINLLNDEIVNYHVKIYNLTGQLVLEEDAIDKSWDGNISNLNSGLYILNIVDESGLVYSQRVNKI